MWRFLAWRSQRSVWDLWDYIRLVSQPDGCLLMTVISVIRDRQMFWCCARVLSVFVCAAGFLKQIWPSKCKMCQHEVSGIVGYFKLMHNNWVTSSFSLTQCDTLHIPYEVRVAEPHWLVWLCWRACEDRWVLALKQCISRALSQIQTMRKSSSGQGCTYHSVLHFKTLIKCNTVVLKLELCLYLIIHGYKNKILSTEDALQMSVKLCKMTSY